MLKGFFRVVLPMTLLFWKASAMDCGWSFVPKSGIPLGPSKR